MIEISIMKELNQPSKKLALTDPALTHDNKVILPKKLYMMKYG